MSQEPSPQRIEAYTQALQNAGEAKARLMVSPILPEEEAIFQVIDALHESLEPVEMDATFRAQLKANLTEAAAREAGHQQIRAAQPPARRSRLPWIASAAALGATATLAGAYAVWRWNWGREAA